MSIESIKQKLKEVERDVGRVEAKKAELAGEEEKLQGQIDTLADSLHRATERRQEVEREWQKLIDRKHQVEDELRHEESRP